MTEVDEQPVESFSWGEPVLLHGAKGRRWLVVLEEGGRFQHHRGEVEHDAIRMAGPGGGVVSHKGQRFRARRPTLEEYVLLMSRAATVTYPKDATAMLMLADVGPGMRVLEAGSGSGGMTLFLSRAVGPSGQVVSVELRQEFANKARRNVAGWGADNVDFVVGDLAEVELEDDSFDAVLLDVQEPWLVLDAVLPALKVGRGVVAYLPNITQVTHLVEATRDHQVALDRVIEVMHREWEIRPPVAHPGFNQINHTAFLAHFRRTRRFRCRD